MEYNFKKSRSQKLKKDGFKKSKIKNEVPLCDLKSPQTVESNVSMGNVNLQNKSGSEHQKKNMLHQQNAPQTVLNASKETRELQKKINNKHQNDVKKDSSLLLQEIPNLKRETDEIKQLIRKTSKSQRFITSNWNILEEVPVWDDTPHNENDFSDFTHLLQASGNHFTFKSERDWDANLSIPRKKPILRPCRLAGCLTCIPMHMKLNMQNTVFSDDEREGIHSYSKHNISKYNIRIKNKNNHILQEDNLNVHGKLSKSNSVSSSSDLEYAVSEPALEGTSMQITSASNNPENISEENLKNITGSCLVKCLEGGKKGSIVYDEINVPEIYQHVENQNLEIVKSNTVRTGNGSPSEDLFDDDLEFLLTLKMPVLETVLVNQLIAPTIDEDIHTTGLVQFSTDAVKSTGNVDDWLQALCMNES